LAIKSSNHPAQSFKFKFKKSGSPYRTHLELLIGER